jgi:hypothetical protein
VSGTFFGPSAEWFAVLGADQATIELFEVSAGTPSQPFGSVSAKDGGALGLHEGPRTGPIAKCDAASPGPVALASWRSVAQSDAVMMLQKNGKRSLGARSCTLTCPVPFRDSALGGEGGVADDRWVTVVGADGTLALVELPAPRRGKLGALTPAFTLKLLPGERVSQVGRFPVVTERHEFCFRDDL